MYSESRFLLLFQTNYVLTQDMNDVNRSNSYFVGGLDLWLAAVTFQSYSYQSFKPFSTCFVTSQTTLNLANRLCFSRVAYHETTSKVVHVQYSGARMDGQLILL